MKVSENEFRSKLNNLHTGAPVALRGLRLCAQ